MAITSEEVRVLHSTGQISDETAKKWLDQLSGNQAGSPDVVSDPIPQSPQAPQAPSPPPRPSSIIDNPVIAARYKELEDQQAQQDDGILEKAGRWFMKATSSPHKTAYAEPRHVALQPTAAPVDPYANASRPDPSIKPTGPEAPPPATQAPDETSIVGDLIHAAATKKDDKPQPKFEDTLNDQLQRGQQTPKIDYNDNPLDKPVAPSKLELETVSKAEKKAEAEQPAPKAKPTTLPSSAKPAGTINPAEHDTKSFISTLIGLGRAIVDPVGAVKTFANAKANGREFHVSDLDNTGITKPAAPKVDPNVAPTTPVNIPKADGNKKFSAAEDQLANNEKAIINKEADIDQRNKSQEAGEMRKRQADIDAQTRIDRDDYNDRLQQSKRLRDKQEAAIDDLKNVQFEEVPDHKKFLAAIGAGLSGTDVVPLLEALNKQQVEKWNRQMAQKKEIVDSYGKAYENLVNGGVKQQQAASLMQEQMLKAQTNKMASLAAQSTSDKVKLNAQKQIQALDAKRLALEEQRQADVDRARASAAAAADAPRRAGEMEFQKARGKAAGEAVGKAEAGVKDEQDIAPIQIGTRKYGGYKAPSGEEAKTVRKSYAHAASVISKIKTIRGLTTGGLPSPNSDASISLDSAIQDLKLQLKNLYQLGALSESDNEMLSKVVDDISTWRNVSNAGGKIKKQIDQLETSTYGVLDALDQTYGGKAQKSTLKE